MATRKCSEKYLEIVSKISNLIGGSADLAGSNNTKTKNHNIIKPGNFSGNYIHYGVREHAMCGVMNGLALHSGLNVNGSGVGQNYRTQGYSGGSGYQWHMNVGTNRFQCIVPLSVGDYVEPRLYIYKTGGTVNNYYNSRGKYPTFRGYLIKRFPSASAPT